MSLILQVITPLRKPTIKLGFSYTYVEHSVYVTGPEKTGLIYTKYTHPYYGIYLFFCVCYLNSVSFIEILRIVWIYSEIFVKIVC